MRENINTKCLKDKVLGVASSCDLKFFVDYIKEQNIFKEVLYNFDMGTSDDASIEIRRDENILAKADVAIVSVAQTMKTLIHPLILNEKRDWENLFHVIEVSMKNVLDYLYHNFEYSFLFAYPFERTLLDINDRPWVQGCKSYWLLRIQSLQYELLSKYENRIDLLDFEEAVLPVGYWSGVFREELYGGHPEPKGAALTAELFLEKIVSRIDTSNKIKAIAVDLDNTLWKGVYLENICPPPVDMQRAWMLCQHAYNGIPICVISKNNPEDEEAIKKYIKEAHPKIYQNIIKYYISWGRKSNAVLQMQKDLSIDVSHIAFFDDNPSERYEVKSSFPSLRVYTEKEIIRTNRYAEFSFYHLSNEAKKRVERYSENMKRKDFEFNNILPLDEYLKSLRLEITFQLASVGDLDRVEELVQRTNQQNILLNRTPRSDIAKYIGNNHCILISLTDRFGDYGVIGCIIYSNDNDVELIELAISCRALGKGIEECIVAFLQNYFSGKGNIVRCVPKLNYKNRNFYEKMISSGFESSGENKEIKLAIDKERLDVEYPAWIHVVNKIL